MLRKTWSEWLQAIQHRNQLARAHRITNRTLRLETLDERLTPAINAILSFGTLTVLGDAQDNSINIVRSTSGNLIVNGGQVRILGGTATVFNTNQIVIMGADGNDSITLTEINGPLPKATVYGGNGNDFLVGGSGQDNLFGQDGDDSIFGIAGNDTLLGGAGKDRLSGGGGDDLFQWNPGDGNDIIEGQGGADKLLFSGSNSNENVDVAANAGRVRVFRDVAAVTIDLNDVESIDFNALGGADTITVNDMSGTDLTRLNLNLSSSDGVGDALFDTIILNGTQRSESFFVDGNTSGTRVSGLQTLVNITGAEGDKDRLVINALGGSDLVNAVGLSATAIGLTANGGLGEDTFVLGAGNDVVNGGDGNDVVLMGAGDDVFQWNPGDDNDLVEGQGGTDKLLFNGANVAEKIEISVNGGRVLFFRDVDRVAVDLNDVESIDVNALGGADVITLNDVRGTDLVDINLNLNGSTGNPDGESDTVIVNGTNNSDFINVFGGAFRTSVLGLTARVNIFGAEAANDRLVINALAGDDFVDAISLLASAIALTVNGGDGNDRLLGGDGDDSLFGGNGNDTLIGGPGFDILDGGPGNNFVLQ